MARPFLDFVHPDDLEATIAEVAQLATGRHTFDFENRYRCHDGSYRWLAWTAIAYEGHIYAAAHDITPIKEAKAALHRANEELEARVVDRTAQIMEVNAQLLTAKQEAERANRAKSEFLSRMSHELRTPLNAILGFGQILDKEETLTSLQQESVQYILTGGRHLLALINEVLDLARVEAGHIELSLEPIALAEIVCEFCALVRPLAAERNIFIEVRGADFGGRHVLADRQRLKQALINLLSNAIKYNRAGGEVRVYGVLQPDNRLTIAVADTGPGISVEDQQRLFIPFERLSAALSGVEGTGLGLAMAQRLVTAMGGSLTLESQSGEGSTFFLGLPLVPSPIEALAEQTTDVDKLELDQSGEARATILYIEDNLSNMRLLEVLLRSRPGITLLPAMQGSVGSGSGASACSGPDPVGSEPSGPLGQRGSGASAKFCSDTGHSGDCPLGGCDHQSDRAFAECGSAGVSDQAFGCGGVSADPGHATFRQEDKQFVMALTRALQYGSAIAK